MLIYEQRRRWGWETNRKYEVTDGTLWIQLQALDDLPTNIKHLPIEPSPTNYREPFPLREDTSFRSAEGSAKDSNSISVWLTFDSYESNMNNLPPSSHHLLSNTDLAAIENLFQKNLIEFHQYLEEKLSSLQRNLGEEIKTLRMGILSSKPSRAHVASDPQGLVRLWFQ